MTPQLDLLLINPNGRKQIYQGLSNDLAAIEPPTWAILIASYLRKNGCSVEIIDADAECLSPEQVAERVAASNPRMVAVVVHGQQPSASTQNMPAARATCQAIKDRSGTPIMMLGTHPSALQERTVLEEPVDWVCEGEGPLSILPLLQNARSNSIHAYKSAKGLWWKERGVIYHNQPAPLLQDLGNEYGSLAWDLLPMNKYRAHNWHCWDDITKRQPYASFYTSFSCPMGCTFCCIAAPYGGSGKGYRRFNPDWVIAEIDTLVTRYGVRNIKFIDEMFVLNEAHVLGICDLIIERVYDLNVWAYARSGTVRDSMLEKLKKAGFHWLGLGIESASSYVRDGVDKSFGKRDIKKVVKKVKDAGICIGANYIFGLPDDTHKTMKDTLDLALELCTDWANFYGAMAYPGSQLYRDALAKGWALPDSWIGYSQHAYETQPLPTAVLTSAEVLRFRDEAFQTYFTNTAYLSYIERRFGDGTLQHVKDMVTIPLPRKLYS